MAQNKNSFLIYCDIKATVDHLTNEQAGELFKHMLSYVNDENPVCENPIIKIAFEPIKQSLKRDLKRYEKIREKRSKAGKASAEKRKQNQQKSTHVESVEQTSTNPTVSVSVSDSVIYKYINPDGNLRSVETEQDFLNLWNEMRSFYLKKPSNRKRLSFSSKQDLENLKSNFGVKEFVKALQGFFKFLNPEYHSLGTDHFLNIDHFQKYLDAGENNYNPYPKKQEQRL